MQGLWDLLGWKEKQNTADSVNFSDGFDASKGEHRDGIAAKIASLKTACWKRDQALYLWYGGLTLNTLLMAGNVYGWLTAGVVTAVGWGGLALHAVP